MLPWHNFNNMQAKDPLPCVQGNNNCRRQSTMWKSDHIIPVANGRHYGGSIRPFPAQFISKACPIAEYVPSLLSRSAKLASIAAIFAALLMLSSCNGPVPAVFAHAQESAQIDPYQYDSAGMIITARSMHTSSSSAAAAAATTSSPPAIFGAQAFKNAYGTILYMGTPRDYEFYIAARVLLQSLARLNVHADLVLIASMDVPDDWVQTFLKEGVRLVRVPNIPNPYSNRPYFNQRFKFSLNKIYAWKLVDYERIVMLDVDNVFLRQADELFLCGQFCAVFIDPCIFHTGLFVLEPSNKVYKSMYKYLSLEKENIDGADQGFLTSYYADLLDKPLFHVPIENRSRLNGYYRLPLGYQMDASYYYIRLKWRVPCGANSVVTFPSASWLKPWYWWSWPVLPLGLLWHDQRKATIGYGTESQMLLAESMFYFALFILAIATRMRVILPANIVDGEQMFRACVPKKVWMKHEGACMMMMNKVILPLCMVASFAVPMWMVPTTAHPVAGWTAAMLGSLSLLMACLTVFKLEVGPVMAPWGLVLCSLWVMACPCYKNGIIRMLAIFGFGAFSTPFLWWSLRSIVCRKSGSPIFVCASNGRAALISALAPAPLTARNCSD